MLVKLNILRIKLNISIWIILILACTACGSNKLQSLKEAIGIRDGKPKIIFVNLIAKRDSLTNRINYELVETIAVDGKVKRSRFDNTEMIPGYILCSVLNDNGVVIDKQVLPDPLERQYEHSDEDGNYTAGTIIEDEREFSVRVNYIEGMKYLEINKILNKDSLKYISTINLLER